MNVELRQNAKNDFEKYFFKFMNNAVLVKTMENVCQAFNNQKKKELVSDPNIIQQIVFSQNLLIILAIEVKRKDKYSCINQSQTITQSIK